MLFGSPDKAFAPVALPGLQVDTSSSETAWSSSSKTNPVVNPDAVIHAAVRDLSDDYCNFPTPIVNLYYDW